MVSRMALVSRYSGTYAPTAVIAAVILFITTKVFVKEPYEKASKFVKIKDFPANSDLKQGFLKMESIKKLPLAKVGVCARCSQA
jgi:hypothetical protein